MNINGFNFTLEMTIITLFVVIVVLLVVLIIAIVNLSKIKKLQKKYERFMLGSNAGSLEEKIMESLAAQEKINSSHDQVKMDIKVLYTKLLSTVQKVSIEKYDAFSNTGGKLSYSIALLDEKDNGIMITSVHSLEGSYNYAKEIKNGTADVLLTNEEQKALEKANKM